MGLGYSLSIANFGTKGGISDAADGGGVPATMTVFLGQSNAEGWTTDPVNTTALTAGYGYHFFPGGGIDPHGISLPGRTQGGPHAAWCQAWCAGGGGPVITVNCAVGGSSMISAAAGAGGTWDLASGSNHWQTTMKARVEAALVAAAANGFSVEDVDFLWVQGEQDAKGYNGTTITDAIYRTKLVALIDQVQADIPNFRKWFVSELGIEQTSIGNDADYVLIRAAQANAIADRSTIANMVYDQAKDFRARALMADGDHYTQAGYNELGTIGAQTALVAIGSPSLPMPDTVKYYEQAAKTPDRTGFKKLVIKTTRVGAIALQHYSGQTTPTANHWKDCSGENRAKANNLNAAPTWSLTPTGEKTIVLYVSATETDVSVVGGGNAAVVELTADDGIGIGTLNFNTAGDTPELTRARVSWSAFATRLTNFSVNANSLGMTDADLAALPNLTILIISTGPPALTRGKTALPAITNFRYATMTSTVSAAVVNAILADCVAAGNSGGTLQISGANNAAPTGQGITDKATLVSRSWTVTTT